MRDDLGGRVKGLRNYEFVDDAARQKFEELMQQLQKQMLDQMFQGIKGSLEQMQGQDLSRVRDMVRELNKMLEQRMEGRTPDFQGFMQKFGDMFPPGINNLDELLEHLQRQMAQMQSLLQSLSPEAREELRQMMDSLLQDDSLRLELARLSGFMQAMMPPSELSERYPFFGEDPLTMGEAMQLMERLQQMDRLESQLERGSFRPDDVDRSLAQQLLGPEARQALDQLRQVTDVLEKAGYVERKGRRLELTPRGMRRIGQSALRDIFDQLKKTRMGQHQLWRGGIGTDASEELKAYDAQKVTHGVTLTQAAGPIGILFAAVPIFICGFALDATRRPNRRRFRVLGLSRRPCAYREVLSMVHVARTAAEWFEEANRWYVEHHPSP